MANGFNGTIEKFTRAGTGSVFASSGLNIRVSLAFDAAGHLYVANQTAKGILKTLLAARRTRGYFPAPFPTP